MYAAVKLVTSVLNEATDKRRIYLCLIVSIEKAAQSELNVRKRRPILQRRLRREVFFGGVSFTKEMSIY